MLKQTFWIILILRFCSLPVIADEQLMGGVNNTLAQIGKRSQNYFSKIQSIEYESTMDGVCLVGPTKDQTLEQTLKYVGKGDEYYFQYLQTGNLNPQPVSSSEAYDGVHYQVLNGDYLKIKTGDQISNPILRSFSPLFMPFSYFLASYQKDHPETRYFAPKLSDFCKQDNWLDFYKNSHFIGSVTKNGVPCYAIELPGMQYGNDVKIKVYFSKNNNFYPVAWERFDSVKKNVGWTYQVDSFGTISDSSSGLQVVYPSKATLLQFNGGDQPIYRATVTIKNLSINNSNLDDSIFTFDAGMASYIYDIDKKVMIQVPK